MEKSLSSDGICQLPTTDLKNDPEKIFTSALIPPLVFCVAYIALVRHWGDDLNKIADNEPFKTVWWSGPIFFSCLYLLTVHFGTKYMASRGEFKVKPYIFTYNLYQCLLNIWCVGAFVHEFWTNPIFTTFWGNDHIPGRPSFRIGLIIWVHYNNKFIELLDTLWMILRKKNKQISFLHCYHHVLLIWAWFLVCKVETGGDVFFGACVNSFIHVIMYGYYTLALLNIPCPWKKYITSMQMVQFMICFAHSCYHLYLGKTPALLAWSQMFVMINMLVLFGNFYVETYSTKKVKKGGVEKKRE
jgi:elongation of very long chain fatty acids protein 4